VLRSIGRAASVGLGIVYAGCWSWAEAARRAAPNPNQAHRLLDQRTDVSGCLPVPGSRWNAAASLPRRLVLAGCAACHWCCTRGSCPCGRCRRAAGPTDPTLVGGRSPGPTRRALLAEAASGVMERSTRKCGEKRSKPASRRLSGHSRYAEVSRGHPRPCEGNPHHYGLRPG